MPITITLHPARCPFDIPNDAGYTVADMAAAVAPSGGEVTLWLDGRELEGSQLLCESGVVQGDTVEVRSEVRLQRRTRLAQVPFAATDAGLRQAIEVLNLNAVSALLEAGVPYKTEHLHKACESDNVKLAEVLLRGVDPSDLVWECTEALVVAGRCNALKVFKLLVSKGGDVSTVDDTLRTALHYSYKWRAADVGEFLKLFPSFEHLRQDVCGRTPLHYAVARGTKELIPKMLRSVAVANHAGDLPLHVAVAIRTDAEYWSVTNHFMPYNVQRATLNAQNAEGDTAAHIAARRDMRYTVEMFVFRRADLTVRNNAGMTPYDVAGEKVKAFLDPSARVPACELLQPPEVTPEDRRHDERSECGCSLM